MKKFKMIKRVQVKLSGRRIHITIYQNGGLVVRKTKIVR